MAITNDPAQETTPAGNLLAADGTPLKRKLAQSLRQSRRRAFGLVIPLLALVLVAFVVPIISMLWQGIYDDRYSGLMPNSTEVLGEWDGFSAPNEALAAALVSDLIKTREDKTIGKVATRVNRELSGVRSLMTSSARRAARMEPPWLSGQCAGHAREL